MLISYAVYIRDCFFQWGFAANKAAAESHNQTVSPLMCSSYLGNPYVGKNSSKSFLIM